MVKSVSFNTILLAFILKRNRERDNLKQLNQNICFTELLVLGL